MCVAWHGWAESITGQKKIHCQEMLLSIINQSKCVYVIKRTKYEKLLDRNCRRDENHWWFEMVRPFRQNDDNLVEMRGIVNYNRKSRWQMVDLALFLEMCGRSFGTKSDRIIWWCVCYGSFWISQRLTDSSNDTTAAFWQINSFLLN